MDDAKDITQIIQPRFKTSEKKKETETKCNDVYQAELDQSKLHGGDVNLTSNLS